MFVLSDLPYEELTCFFNEFVYTSLKNRHFVIYNIESYWFMCVSDYIPSNSDVKKCLSSTYMAILTLNMLKPFCAEYK